MNCEQCETNLFDFHEGSLNETDSAAIDRHLQDCENCTALLNDIWQMGLVASRWQDESPEAPERLPAANAATQWQWPNIVATAASVLALVMVITDTRVAADANGIAIRFGEQNFVTTDTLQTLNQKQVADFQSQIDRITDQQVASDQLVLRTVLEASREERRDEFASLVTLWTTNQARQAEQTQRNFRYLLASQAEDEKDIKQLSAAFQEISLRQSANM